MGAERFRHLICSNAFPSARKDFISRITLLTLPQPIQRVLICTPWGLNVELTPVGNCWLQQFLPNPVLAGEENINWQWPVATEAFPRTGLWLQREEGEKEH